MLNLGIGSTTEQVCSQWLLQNGSNIVWQNKQMTDECVKRREFFQIRIENYNNEWMASANVTLVKFQKFNNKKENNKITWTNSIFDINKNTRIFHIFLLLFFLQ